MVKILVTGAKGFVGKNLVKALEQVRDGKDRRERYQPLLPLTIYEYSKDSDADDLAAFCGNSDFVFNLAGVNRPQEHSEYMEGNHGFVRELVGELERHNNMCPVMLASSIQASLQGRFAGSEYGKSKQAGEEILCDYSKRTGAPILIYRLPNLYGKWSRPNYNSVIATFCNNIAHDLPIVVDDPTTKLELLYIDDLVSEMMEALMESIIYANARTGAGRTTICCTRYGNVMCSRGSVIPLFAEQIAKGEPNTITDPNMTRFLMSLDESVDLVCFAFENAHPGDLFIQKASACTIGDLAEAIQQVFGRTGVKVIGTRHGEKLFETLMTREERLRAEDMGDYFRIHADTRDLNYDKFVVHGDVETMADESYTSHNTDRLDIAGIIDKIKSTEYVQNMLARVEI